MTEDEFIQWLRVKVEASKGEVIDQFESSQYNRSLVVQIGGNQLLVSIREW